MHGRDQQVAQQRRILRHPVGQPHDQLKSTGALHHGADNGPYPGRLYEREHFVCGEPVSGDCCAIHDDTQQRESRDLFDLDVCCARHGLKRARRAFSPIAVQLFTGEPAWFRIEHVTGMPVSHRVITSMPLFAAVRLIW